LSGRQRALPLLLASCLAGSGPAPALELPPTCAADRAAPDEATPLEELRRRVEAQAETDPTGAVRLLCATIPRVERESGADSVELAWWLVALATPLIAYLDRHAEALPLLDRARTILERRAGPEAPELAEIHVAHAWINFRQGRLSEARAAWAEALRIRERWPGPGRIELQKVLVGLAQVDLSLRDFARARESLHRAYAILEDNDATLSEAAAAIQNAFTNLALREEDYPAARRHAEELLRIERALEGGAPQLVPAHALLGQVLERLDEFEQSERALREAVRLAESSEGPLQRHHLAALTQLGRLLAERGKPREALAVSRRALEVGEATLGADAPRLVRVRDQLADTLRTLGELPEALRLYLRSAAILEAHPADVERPHVVAHYRGRGTLELSLGETEQARATLRLALDAVGQDPTLLTERAAVLLALARAAEPGDERTSRARLLEALELFRARLPEGHPTLLRVINDLCGLEIDSAVADTPHCDEAARRLASAREVEPALRQAVYDQRSRLAERREEHQDAYAFAVRALAAAAGLGTPDPLWQAHFRLARLERQRGDRKLAILFGKQSIAQIERLRGSLVGEDRRYDRGFLQDKVDVYRSVADWLLEAGRVDEGLEVLRLLKGEELYDFVLRNATPDPQERGVAFTADEQALWQRYLATLDTDAAAGQELERLSRLRESDRISVEERARLEELLAGRALDEARRAERIGRFLAEARARAPSAERPARPVQAERLARDLERLGADSALAVYLLTEEHVRVLVATRDGQLEHRIPLDAPSLRRAIGRFLDGISRRDDVADASHELYETLGRPVDEAARRAGATRLVLWLDGALRYLPFGALHDGERYLGERYVIQSYAEPDGSASGPDAATDRAPRVLGLGVTRAVGGYRSLPAMADELCHVIRGPINGLVSTSAACPRPEAGNGALRGVGYADAAFTEQRLEARLHAPRDFSILHLGTHFSLRPGNALRSFLVLGDGSRLTLDEIGALDFSGIELFTLSACQTGLGGALTEDGREVEALSTIVQRRGARRVVASLWQVEDSSTARLMHAMYRAIADDHLDASRALQRAQLALRSFQQGDRRPYAHPYYWAGFVISGSAP
jgi:CHAT domain-containing protein